MNLPTVLITGATGLVGLNLVRYLLERDYRVTALVRPTSDQSELLKLEKGGKLAIAVAELSDVGQLKNQLPEHDVVVHAAGSVDPYGSRQQIFAINVECTRTVLQAAVETGVRQFVHISSLSVITGQDDQYGVDESAPLRYCGENYADSKVDAEKLVMAEGQKGKIAVTVLRPGFIYGPGERAWMPRLITNLTAGKVMLIDGGLKETNVIYVGNLCRAIESSFLNENSYGKAYNLTDGQQVTKKQLFDAISEGLKLPKVTRTIPYPVAKLACQVISAIAPALGPDTQRKLSRFSKAAFRLAGVNQGFDISRAEKELNYTDRIPFEAGMAETLKSFTSKAEQPNPAAARK